MPEWCRMPYLLKRTINWIATPHIVTCMSMRFLTSQPRSSVVYCRRGEIPRVECDHTLNLLRYHIRDPVMMTELLKNNKSSEKVQSFVKILLTLSIQMV